MNPSELTTSSHDPSARATEDARHVLKLGEVALLCGVPDLRVFGWVKDGMLHASCTTDGYYRIDAGDLIAFLIKYDILEFSAG